MMAIGTWRKLSNVRRANFAKNEASPGEKDARETQIGEWLFIKAQFIPHFSPFPPVLDGHR